VVEKLQLDFPLGTSDVISNNFKTTLIRSKLLLCNLETIGVVIKLEMSTATEEQLFSAIRKLRR